MSRSLIIFAFLFCWLPILRGGEYYISPEGNDSSGNGSYSKPWKTLTQAVRDVPDDGSSIIAKDGLYVGGYSFSRHFEKPCLIVAEHPYQARFSSPKTSNRLFYLTDVSNITFRGLDCFGSGSSETDYLIQISTKNAHHIRFENCLLRDSYKNDLIKINARASFIVFSGCAIFNPMQNGGDEIFDINMVTDIVIEDSLLFNDYPGSGREDANASHSLIVIKNSGSTPDVQRCVVLRRNIFFNWAGRTDQAFVLLGEDGQPFYEAQDVLIENNLFLYNSSYPFWGALLFKGGMRNVVVRANTITGHPTTAADRGGAGFFLVNCYTFEKSPLQSEMVFANNLCCDNTGKMPRFAIALGKRFAADGVRLNNNVYWNGGKPIPSRQGSKNRPEENDAVAPINDARAVLADPRLPDVPLESLAPGWDPETGRFRSGGKTIREEFERLVETYAVPGSGSSAIDGADPSEMPKDDILGKPRNFETPDIGCYEIEK